MNVHSNLTHKSQKLKISQMSIIRKINKVLHIRVLEYYSEIIENKQVMYASWTNLIDIESKRS